MRLRSRGLLPPGTLHPAITLKGWGLMTPTFTITCCICILMLGLYLWFYLGD